MNQQDDALSDALATVHDAGAVRVPPWMALAAALASIRPDDIGASIDWLVLHRDELQRAYADGRDKRLGLAKLPPAMLYQPELGHLDRPRNDHVLRERHISPTSSASAPSSRPRSTRSPASSWPPATPRCSSRSATST